MSEVFCERLKRFRKESGLTQLQFSEKIGVHLQTVSKWERGVSEPDFALLGLIAQTLNVSLERLIGTEESETVYTTYTGLDFNGHIAFYSRKGADSAADFPVVRSSGNV